MLAAGSRLQQFHRLDSSPTVFGRPSRKEICCPAPEISASNQQMVRPTFHTHIIVSKSGQHLPVARERAPMLSSPLSPSNLPSTAASISGWCFPQIRQHCLSPPRSTASLRWGAPHFGEASKFGRLASTKQYRHQVYLDTFVTNDSLSCQFHLMPR